MTAVKVIDEHTIELWTVEYNQLNHEVNTSIRITCDGEHVKVNRRAIREQHGFVLSRPLYCPRCSLKLGCREWDYLWAPRPANLEHE